MVRFIKSRLSVMMFLQLFASGALTPILSLYLKGYLHFTGTQTGIIIGMSSISAILAPLIGTFIADRMINSERLLGICHLTGAVLIFLLSFQKDFIPVLILYIFYAMTLGSTFSLTNAITFHHSPDSKKNYGSVRVWGTIGWIAAAWALGLLWMKNGLSPEVSDKLPLALKVSALASFILGLYAFSLPLAHKKLDSAGKFLPVESFRVMLKPSILIISFLSLLINCVDRYYYFGTAPFLKQIGFSEASIMPLMSIGQIPEIFGMTIVGYLLKRFSFKPVLITGVIMEILRFSFFAAGSPPALIYAGLAIHGLTYTFYSVVVFIYLDSHCDKQTRTGVQQLYSIIAMALGSFLGSFIAGKMMDVFNTKLNRIDYTFFWMVPAVISAVVMIGILFLIKNEKAKINKSSGLKGEKIPADLI